MTVRLRKDVLWLADILLALGEGPDEEQFVRLLNLPEDEIRLRTAQAQRRFQKRHQTRFLAIPRHYRDGKR